MNGKRLTYSELRILKHMIEGFDSKEIAGIIGCSYKTVEVHRHHMLSKTGCKNSIQLVVEAMRKGWVK